MKRKLSNLSRRYQAALRMHLKQGPRATLDSAQGLGSRALSAGLQTLDLAKLHEQTLVNDVLPDCPPGTRAQAAHKEAQHETLRRCGRDRIVQTPRGRPEPIVFCGCCHILLGARSQVEPHQDSLGVGEIPNDFSYRFR